ncbi:MAG TPA: hypothetical protein VFP89_07845 [Propionibacteriaceae bacterium]|nr:hypothetical protein [Propionibacteriaceae bacterium]
MTHAYLETVESIVPQRLLDRLFDTFRATPNDPGGRDVAAILDDSDLGPVARSVAVLWYCGTWTQLPSEWRARNGASASDITGVVSSAAYQTGLQWTVIGAHPAGARQQGFGAWATAPADLIA